MARVIVDEQSVVVKTWWHHGRIILIGAVLGMLWWFLTGLLQAIVVDPIVCRDVATACVDSRGIAGALATVIIAVASLALLVRIETARPIIIAIGSAIVLWNLARYLNGLSWFESVAWAVGLYAASYALFALVRTIPRLLWANIVAVLVVLVITIALAVY